MASGQTLIVWLASDFEALSPTNTPGLTVRNNHQVLGFDTAPAGVEYAYFKGILPRNYAGGGITVYVHYAMASATTGTCGWLVAFERIGDGSQDIDADGFAGNQTITAVTVPGTSGNVDIVNVAVTDGANIDSIAVGEVFRLRITRDTASDTAAGDGQLVAIELKET